MTKLLSTLAIIAEETIALAGAAIMGLVAIPAFLFVYVALPLAMLAFPFWILSIIF